MTRDIVVAGALPRHQVRTYLRLHWIEFMEEPREDETTRFTVLATEAQWGQIQEWVRKVTG